MNKLIFTFIALFFLNSCSLNENSRIWKEKENKVENEKKTTKVFVEEKASVSEFNQNQKAKEFFNQIIALENSNPDIRLQAEKRLNRDLSE